MSFTLSIWSLILLIGCIQALLVAGVAMFKKPGHQTSQYILIGLLLIFAVILFDHSLRLSELYLVFPYGLYISDALWYLISPLIWLYLITRVENRSLQFRDAWHFIPYVFFLFMYRHLPFLPYGQKIEILEQYQQNDFHYSTTVDIFIGIMMLQIQAYLWYSYRFLNRYIRNFKKNASGNEIQALIGIKWIIFTFAFYFLLEFSFSSIKGLFDIPNQFTENWSLVMWTLFLIVLAFKMIQHPAYFFKKIRPVSRKQEGGPVEDLERKLIHCMEAERPYLDKDLTLPQLAGLIQTSSHHLSYLLNGKMNTSFYRFVNTYRVRDVAQKLKAGEHRQLSIFGLAQGSGFKSKASFYSFFKKEFGMTPKAYISELEQ